MKLLSIKKIKHAGLYWEEAVVVLHLVPDYSTSRWNLFAGSYLPFWKSGQYMIDYSKKVTGWRCLFVCLRLKLPCVERYPGGLFFGWPKIRFQGSLRPVFKQKEQPNEIAS